MFVSEKFKRVYYLYNITSIDNIDSILKYGLLSKNEIIKRRLPYKDISNQSVQKNRDNVIFGNGHKLHDYANLYFNPRNAMLYFLLLNGMQRDLCIIRFDKSVLNIEDIVITNQNAAVEVGTKFMTAEEAAKHLDFSLIRSKDWNDKDPLTNDVTKKAMMAEVLIYGHVPKEYIKEIIVPTIESKRMLESKNINIPIIVDSWLFFDSLGGK